MKLTWPVRICAAPKFEDMPCQHFLPVQFYISFTEEQAAKIESARIYGLGIGKAKQLITDKILEAIESVHQDCLDGVIFVEEKS